MAPAPKRHKAATRQKTSAKTKAANPRGMLWLAALIALIEQSEGE